MDWSQYLYAAILCFAIAFGRPPFVVVFAMFGNLVATVAWADSYVSVAIADLVAAALLVFGGFRGQLVALIFIAMQPVYLAAWAFAWPAFVTYAIIDVLAYAQCGIIGNVDRGSRNLVRRFRGRRHHSSDTLAQGRDAGGAVALRERRER